MATVRNFFQENCTVFTWDSDTNLLNVLGNGTLRIECEMAENNALMDAWSIPNPIKNRAVVDLEIAMQSGGSDSDWIALAAVSPASATTKTLSITVANGTRSGSFYIESAEEIYDDGMRWRVRLVSSGALSAA